MSLQEDAAKRRAPEGGRWARGDPMNQKQRITIIAGIVLVALCGLVPPYNGEMVQEGDNLKTYMGYHLLFDPPTPQEVAQALGFGKIAALSWFSSRIDLDRIFLQMVTIIIVTIGATIVLSEKKQIP